MQRNHQLPYADWPVEDRRLWQAAFEEGDLFDEGAGAHLSAATRKWLKSDYSCFLGFLKAHRPDLLERAPHERLNRGIVEQFVQSLLQTCSEITVGSKLRNLRHALKAICPQSDWLWLGAIANRIAARARPRPQKHVTSDQLYALGIQLMEQATAAANAAGSVTVGYAVKFRDGLLIALLAAIPLRRRTLANLRIGEQLVQSGGSWELDIPAEDTKTCRPLAYSAESLSPYIDRYLQQFRNRIPGAGDHKGLWPSKLGQPMADDSVLFAVKERTRAAFGFPVSPHRFRHAAATFWAERDPANVRGVADLLGHASPRTTEKHYNKARTRLAGRRLAQVIDRIKRQPAA